MLHDKAASNDKVLGMVPEDKKIKKYGIFLAFVSSEKMLNYFIIWNYHLSYCKLQIHVICWLKNNVFKAII